MNSETPKLATILSAEEEKLLACIHCGLCLEACPTYVITGDENDGPRGRLYLMRAVGEGRLPKESHAFERHIDRCLGCRACEQVCPAGVEYGSLLEAARAELFTSKAQNGFRYRVLRFVLRHIWLRPARLKFVFALMRLVRDTGLATALRKTGVARLISYRFEFSVALLESSADKVFGNSVAHSGLRDGQGKSETLLLFTGCVGDGLFQRVNRATERVLTANNFVVQTPGEQVCCGALHAHAGDLEGARVLARRNVAAFSQPAQTTIITNAGGCGAMLSSYGDLLSSDETFAAVARTFSERVRDVSQQLEFVGTKPGATITTGTVTYDASCHLLYGQHVGEAPLKMLAGISELDFKRLEGSERCCGGAGIYNLLEPELSREVLAEKLANIQASGGEVLVTGNPGCQMQIGAGARLAGMNLRICHPIELVDESYARAGFYNND